MQKNRAEVFAGVILHESFTNYEDAKTYLDGEMWDYENELNETHILDFCELVLQNNGLWKVRLRYSPRQITINLN